MASSSKKKLEEENNLKSLREIVALTHNKHCFDCNQRGPTYVNMTIGSFVCTACSGLLRGLNPPHRVKSISMASFSNDEMEFIKSRGNDFCRKVWLGMFDQRIPTDIDSKDESRMKDAMSQRYEKKRWYIHPSESLFEEARRLNIAGKQGPVTASVKPLSSIVAGLPLSTMASSNVQRPQANRPNSEPTNPSFPGQSPVSVKLEQQQQQPKKQFDILADFGSDPFATPARISSSSQPSASEGFADFSTFNAFPQQNQSLFTQPSNWQQVSAFNHPAGNTATGGGVILQPNSNFNKPASIPAASVPPQPSDKYSALASLDGESTVFGMSFVDWEGHKKSTGWTPTNTTQHFNQASSAHPPPPSYNSLAFPPAHNPFGSPSTSMSTMGSHAPIPNPFMMTQPAQMPTYFSSSRTGAYPGAPQVHNSHGGPGSVMPLPSSHFGNFQTMSGLPGPSRAQGPVPNGTSQIWGAPPPAAVPSHIPATWGTPQMQAGHNPFLANTGGSIGQIDSISAKNPYNPFL